MNLGSETAGTAQQSAVQHVDTRIDGGPDEAIIGGNAQPLALLGVLSQVLLDVLVFPRETNFLRGDKEAELAEKSSDLSPAGDHGHRDGEEQGYDQG